MAVVCLAPVHAEQQLKEEPCKASGMPVQGMKQDRRMAFSELICLSHARTSLFFERSAEKRDGRSPPSATHAQQGLRQFLSA